MPRVPGAYGSPGGSRGQLPGGFARSGQGRSGFGNGGFGNGGFGKGGFGNGDFGMFQGDGDLGRDRGTLRPHIGTGNTPAPEWKKPKKKLRSPA